MSDIILKNKQNEEVVLRGVESLSVENTSGDIETFIQPKGSIDIREVGVYNVKNYASINVYDTDLTSINVRKNVSIMGVTGTLEEKLSELSPTVELDMASGNQEIQSPSEFVYRKVTINKPNTLIADNIKKDVNIAGIVGTFEGSGGGSEEGKVIFIDYDGTEIEEWSASIVASKSALPNNPSHTGLIAQGWNWSLANIKSYISKYPEATVVVGQMYATASGLTEFDITLTKVTGLRIYCKMAGNKDWGDGTTDNLTYHTYDDYGDYTITCDGNTAPRNTLSQDVTDDNNQVCTAIRIGNNVLTISDNAFRACYSLESVTIPNSITLINASTFSSCYSLKSVIIPAGVTSIGDSAFYVCRSLKSISIPDSVTNIGSDIFRSNAVLKLITIPDGVTSIKLSAFHYCYSLTSIIIPDSVTSIGNNAFYNCYSLESITIPDSVRSIGNSVFMQCYSLKSVIIADGVTSIGTSAFHLCSSLTSIIIPDSVTSIGIYAFQECYSLKSAIISAGVTSIDHYTFNGCSSLTSVTIPDGVTSIGAYAFYECSSLKTISIPDSVTSIGVYAFALCYSLALEIVLNGVSIIDVNSFAECSDLISITFLGNVTNINTNAFSYCYKIIKYDFSNVESVPALSSTNAFNKISKICKIIVPDDLYDDWIVATNWSTYADYIYKASEVE